MPITVTSPTFSFVRFQSTYNMIDADNWLNNNSPNHQLVWPLPIADPWDIRFQVKITASNAATAAAICNWTPTTGPILALLPGIQTVYNGSQAAYWPTLPGESQLSWQRISEFEWILSWESPLTNIFNFIDVGQCFQLGLWLPNGAVIDFFISNPFMRVEDDGYTALLVYNCENDQYGFWYCHNTHYYNQVRLPTWGKLSGYLEDEKVYVKSNGRKVLRKSVVTKQYEFITDQMPEWAHDALETALKHEEIYIGAKIFNTHNVRLSIGDNYSGVVKEGPYEPSFPDYLGFPWGTAKFKLSLNGNMLKFDNCNDCVDNSHYTNPTIDSPAPISYAGCETFNINIADLIVSCAGPITYSINWTNTLRVNPVPPPAISTAGVLTFKMRIPTLSWVPGVVQALVVVHIHVNGQTWPVTIYGSYNGSSLC